MDAARWQRIAAIFDRVAEQPSGARAACLDELCGHDAPLRAEIEALLRADRRGGAFESALDATRKRAAGELVVAADEPVPEAGERVGPWRVVRELGAGGMGRVWLAERDDGQFEQRAALKMARSGAADEELQRRILYERNIVARLEHPNIARLIDGGVAGDGRPYFAMEYVDGRTLLDHCGGEGLAVEARLALFAEVCAAVQFAHSRLVIHGDIKPANILVTSSGMPKLLDFGIARMLEAGERAGNERVALTAGYAAPEQRCGASIGTAADIYSLGVVLHELVYGSRPAASGPGAPAGNARAARGRWRDAAWIVARALAPDPHARYATVQAFADDVERLVAGRPVLAHPDGAAYRLRRFAARHRYGVFGAATAAATLVAVTAFALWQAHEKTREATVARQVTEFVVGLFRAADPALADGPAVTAQDLLDRGQEKLRESAKVDTTVRSDLLQTLARTYMGLGLYDRALPVAQQALALRRVTPGAETLPVAESLQTLGSIYRLKADYAQSEPLLRDALRLRRALLSDSSPAVIESVDELANLLRARGRFAQADRYYDEARHSAERTFGTGAVETARYLDDYAANLDDLGRRGDAARNYRRALEIREARRGPEHADVATSLLNLGNHLDESGDYAAAAPLLERALRIRLHVFGPDHPLVAGAQLGLASVYDDMGRLADAERSAEDAVRIFRASLPENHPRVSESLNMLGLIRVARRDFAGAAVILRDVVARFRQALGEDHPDTLAAMNNLAYALMRSGATAEAEALQREVLARSRSDNGQGTQAFDSENLATTLAEEGRFDEAVAYERRALALRRAEDGTASANVAVALRVLGIAEGRAGDAVAAERDLRAALEMADRTSAAQADYPFAIALADFLAGRARCAEAVPLLDGAQRKLQAAAAPDPVWLPQSALLLSACGGAAAKAQRAQALARLAAIPAIAIDLLPTARQLVQSASQVAPRVAAQATGTGGQRAQR